MNSSFEYLMGEVCSLAFSQHFSTPLFGIQVCMANIPKTSFWLKLTLQINLMWYLSLRLC